MNKIGIYYAFWERNWDADFVPYVEKVAKLGFNILEVNSGIVTEMSDNQRIQLKNEALRHNIELTFCIGLTSKYDIAAKDDKIRKNGIDFLKRQAEMLKFMEAKKLGGIIYGSWPGTLPAGEVDKRPYWDRSVSAMKEVM